MYYIIESSFLYNNFFKTVDALFLLERRSIRFVTISLNLKDSFRFETIPTSLLIAFNNLFLFLHSLSRRLREALER